MYKYIILIFTILSLNSNGIAAQEKVYRTDVYREDIKSLQVKVAGEMISSPYIELNGDKRIEITFDALHYTNERFVYSIIHCDADWKQSVLIPIEYMKGFQQAPLDERSYSINTTTHYANYRLSLPNNDVQLIVSGNYAVQVFSENKPNDAIFTACFSVVEPLVEIEPFIKGNTDIDFNKEHQQIEFNIQLKNIQIAYPQNELKILVYQNNNLNDIRTDFQPFSITGNQIQYQHVRNLIFTAGNEFRRIEFLTHRTNGMGVERTAFYDPFYHITLYRDTPRANKTYLYDQDQNGRFFVHCRDCQNPNTEADYYVVHFALATTPFLNGQVYLSGEFTYYQLDEKYRMEYNIETGCYEKAILLKLGLYNYQYVVVDNNTQQSASVTPTEGAYFDTENEYAISVYYRPAAARYDRLIGIKTAKN